MERILVVGIQIRAVEGMGMHCIRKVGFGVDRQTEDFLVVAEVVHHLVVAEVVHHPDYLRTAAEVVRQPDYYYLQTVAEEDFR